MTSPETSPEERREAQLKAFMHPRALKDHPLTMTSAAAHLDRLLAYFQEHEPAVADAIRYGLGALDVHGYANEQDDPFLDTLISLRPSTDEESAS